MALWTVFLDNVGSALNVTQAQAGLVMSLIGTAFIDAVIGIATGSGLAVVIVSTLAIISFSAIGWFPLWTGAIVAIIGGLLFVQGIRDQL